MKLWLDDERDPVVWRPQDGHQWLWLKTAEEAIELIAEDVVCEISFDHDLGEGSNGYDVAKFIEEGAYSGTLTPIKWAVHSANPVGAANIERAMEQADIYWHMDSMPSSEETKSVINQDVTK